MSNETKDIVQKYGFRFTKSLGQNFLVDLTVVDDIIKGSQIDKDDHVIEIGPGVGTLTRELLKAAGRVTAIELDEKLLPILQEELKDYTNLNLIHADATKVDFAEIAEGGKIKFVALAQLNISKKNTFYIVKAVTANKRTAWLISFSNGNFEAVFPLLILDDDESTTQISSIEKSGGINKMVSQKKPGGNTAEGRDVYQYIPESRRFALVLTNPLNSITKVINPIDTLPHKNKLSGDYVKDKKNFISVRDGRSATQILVFIHIEHGDCSGEIKGEMLMTSPTTAVYRQSGDLCAVTLHFSGSSVTVKEDRGCGSRRGLDCSFNNTFSRKKEAKTKSSKRKSSSK